MSITTARRVAEQSFTAYQNLIGGKWQAASDGRTVDMVSPSDGQAFARIARGTKADVDAAVKAARHAFEEGAWGKMTAVERGRLMTKLGEAILANHEELSQLEARDCGKPMKQARADITAAARYFEYYGGAADKYHGDTIPFLDGYMVTILREPKGVTGHIIPWNYPAQMFGRSLAPALAMGNSVVMKPAEDACVTPVRMAQEVGFPPGALNVVTGIGEEDALRAGLRERLRCGGRHRTAFWRREEERPWQGKRPRGAARVFAYQDHRVQARMSGRFERPALSN